MNLKDSVIIVTGASSGIGESTAKHLAKQGAKVVLTARREDRLEEIEKSISNSGGQALVITGDVTKAQDMKDVVAKTIERFGTVDGIINNAGVMPLSYLNKLKTDEWDKMVDVNIKGVLNGVASVLPTFIDKKGGHIINVSSSAAHNYFPGGAVYCATKSAVKMFSEGLRQELAPKYGINVTSIEPGAVSTELVNSISDEDVMEDMKQMKEMTMLEAQDIAEAIGYSLSQPGRANVNAVYVMPSEQPQ